MFYYICTIFLFTIYFFYCKFVLLQLSYLLRFIIIIIISSSSSSSSSNNFSALFYFS